MKALIITLYIYSARCLTIKSFYAQIKKSDWLFLIENIKQSCFIVIKMFLQQKKGFLCTNSAIAIAFGVKKDQWLYLKNQTSKLN